MIDMIRQWLIGVIAAAACLSVLEAMVPKGAVKGIAKVTGGLVMFLVLLRPWMNADLTDLEWKYQDYQQQINEQIGTYREDYQQQMESIIERELSAYISKKAEQMDLPCQVKVETEIKNEVPVPAAVRLSIKKDDALSAWIEEELGIGATQQHWEDER